LVGPTRSDRALRACCHLRPAASDACALAKDFRMEQEASAAKSSRLLARASLRSCNLLPNGGAAIDYGRLVLRLVVSTPRICRRRRAPLRDRVAVLLQQLIASAASSANDCLGPVRRELSVRKSRYALARRSFVPAGAVLCSRWGVQPDGVLTYAAPAYAPTAPRGA
jgi:hypothetical protein